jgi:hypothetical protein
MSGIYRAAGIIDKGKPIGVDVSRGTNRFIILIGPVRAYKTHLPDTAAQTRVRGQTAGIRRTKSSCGIRLHLSPTR